MSECLFCKIAQGDIPADIVHEDDDLLAFRDIDPQAPVHILLIPRAHISSLLDASDRHVELLGKLQHAAVEIARRLGLGERGFRLVTNCLEEGGQAVDHLHSHLLGGRKMGWPPG